MSERSNSVGIGLVGCGFMGRRHLRAYAALRDAGYLGADLRAVIDLDSGVAEALADEAERVLGARPAIYRDLGDAVLDAAVEAVDVVTDPRTHHTLAVKAMAAGRHVLCEKPLGLTVRAARLMLEEAEASGTVLATAENYRRGGGNRMARAVLDAGLLGRVHLMVEERVGGDDSVLISPWRHLKETGAISLDMGTHLLDIVEYLLGPIATAWGHGFIAEPVRRAASGDVVQATGEDSLVALLRTESGVDVQLAYLPSGPGHEYVRRTLHGSAGSMIVPEDRTDGSVVVRTADGVLKGESLREAVGAHFRLDEVTQALLGRDGSGGKGAPFERVDAGYIGVEIADFADAILNGRAPEVDGVGGLRAVAGVYAVLESGRLGQPVPVGDVVDGTLRGYQDEIDESLGLVDFEISKEGAK